MIEEIKFQGNSKGQTLIEVLIALAILGIVAVAFMTALTTASRAIIVADEHTTAESLTRSELEYVKNVSYDNLPPDSGWFYQLSTNPAEAVPPPWEPGRKTLASHYTNYSVKVDGVPIDPNTHNPLPAGKDDGIQRITVEVYHQGKLVLTTSTYKVSRWQRR